MTMTGSTAVDECAAGVEATFSALFHQIEDWRDRLQELSAERSGRLSAADVDELVEMMVAPQLGHDGALTIGAGYVATPGFLVDTDWHLAWWLGRSNTFGLGSADPSVRRLVATEDPTAEDFRDYTELEWWRVPAATGAAHITGPYVDYLCTDDYTLTLTMPVRHGDRMIGVAGADLYVNDIERALLPFVRSIGQPATILNASGRVVVSTDPHLATGSVLRQPHEAGVRCGATSLILMLG
jgi:hypothetical protein